MIHPEVNQQFNSGRGLHYFDNLKERDWSESHIMNETKGCICHEKTYGVVDGVFVLLKPVGDVIGHNSSIVGDGKVGVLVGLRLRLQEDGQLAEGGLQLLLKGLVSGLWEERLLLEDGPDAHGFLKHDDGSSEIHSKVNHFPIDALLDIFLLFHNEPEE